MGPNLALRRRPRNLREPADLVMPDLLRHNGLRSVRFRVSRVRAAIQLAHADPRRRRELTARSEFSVSPRLCVRSSIAGDAEAERARGEKSPRAVDPSIESGCQRVPPVALGAASAGAFWP